MSKIEIYCKIKNRPIKVDKRLADALVKMKRAEYITEKGTYHTKDMVADRTTPVTAVTPTPHVETETNDERENLKAILDSAGVEYDGRSSLKKLQDLVDELTKPEEEKTEQESGEIHE